MTYPCHTLATWPRTSHTQLKKGTNLRGGTTSGQKEGSQMVCLGLEVLLPATLLSQTFQCENVGMVCVTT